MASDLSPSISFVVPCYNEADNVADTVAEIRSAADARPREYEIILVDDHSLDRTGEVMARLAADDRRIRVLRNQVNLGYGGAYKRGAAAASMDHVMLIPGDNGFPAGSIAEILQHVGQADIVIPHVDNRDVRARWRTFVSGRYTALLNFLFRLRVSYYHSAVVHRTALLRTVTVTSNGFGFQAEAVVKLLARGCSYVECGISIREREAGQSSALRPKNVVSVVRTIAHLLCTVGLFRRYRLKRSVSA